jgi:hypothetical protein
MSPSEEESRRRQEARRFGRSRREAAPGVISRRESRRDLARPGKAERSGRPRRPSRQHRRP